MDKPFRGPLLNRAIQDHLKHYITEHHLQAGDMLPPEGQIAEELGVGRGSVREAIKALESLGIVEVRHGNGVFVRSFNFDSVLDLLSYGLVFDPSRIADILQIRRWLEATAIVEVVHRIRSEQIAQIEEVLARWETKADAHISPGDEDRAFHRMLYGALGNASLIALLDTFWLVFHAVPVRTITTDLQPTTTLQDHRDILAAVRAGDAALAQQRVQEHFSGIETRLQKAASGRDPEDTDRSQQ
jgi:DNA-binding FadR family transcriptional regulator